MFGVWIGDRFFFIPQNVFLSQNRYTKNLFKIVTNHAPLGHKFLFHQCLGVFLSKDRVGGGGELVSYIYKSVFKV